MTQWKQVGDNTHKWGNYLIKKYGNAIHLYRLHGKNWRDGNSMSAVGVFYDDSVFGFLYRTGVYKAKRVAKILEYY